jgi:hypothetical protein
MMDKITVTRIDDHIVVTAIADNTKYEGKFDKSTDSNIIELLVNNIINKNDTTFKIDITDIHLKISTTYCEVLKQPKEFDIILPNKELTLDNKINSLIVKVAKLNKKIDILEILSLNKKYIKMDAANVIMKTTGFNETAYYGCGESLETYNKFLEQINKALCEITKKYEIGIDKSNILSVILTYISFSSHYHLVSIKDFKYKQTNDGRNNNNFICSGIMKFEKNDRFFIEYSVDTKYHDGSADIILYNKLASCDTYITTKSSI